MLNQSTEVPTVLRANRPLERSLSEQPLRLLTTIEVYIEDLQELHPNLLKMLNQL